MNFIYFVICSCFYFHHVKDRFNPASPSKKRIPPDRQLSDTESNRLPVEPGPSSLLQTVPERTVKLQYFIHTLSLAARSPVALFQTCGE